MWVISSIVAAAGLLVVLVALVLDPSPAPRAPGARRPDGLPRPTELRRLRFPATWLGGYDPRVVDEAMATLAEGYEALYLAAGPSVIADAERRLAGAADDGTEPGAPG